MSGKFGKHTNNYGKSSFLMGRSTISMTIHKIWLLVVSLPPLKNDGVSSSVGMMTFPTKWKVIKFHGSKPQISFGMFLYTWFLNE